MRLNDLLTDKVKLDLYQYSNYASNCKLNISSTTVQLQKYREIQRKIESSLFINMNRARLLESA